MGKADIITKAYMRENEVFADAFNFMMYNGEPVIDAGKLKELDVTEIAVPLVDEDTDDISAGTSGASESNGRKTGKQSPADGAVQRYRDLLKSCIVMQDGKIAYVLLGIENQTEVHYAMPVRNMVYDALQYARQVNDVSAAHKKERTGGNRGAAKADMKKQFLGSSKSSEHPASDSGHNADRKVSRGEYLSGFYRGDKIIPVITLVVHFGADNWDGPLSLYDMMSIKDETVLSFVQNYKIHLIDPSQLGEQDLAKFHSSLREVLGYIKYSKDKKKLAEFIHDNPRMNLPREAAQVIQTLTNTNIEIPEGKEEIDMCQAIDDMLKDSREEGREEGQILGTVNTLHTIGYEDDAIVEYLRKEYHMDKEKADLMLQRLR